MMMNITLKIILVAVSVITTVSIIETIRKSQLDITYSVIWILFSLFLLFMAIFSKAIAWFATYIGYENVTHFVFTITFFFLLIVCFNQQVRISDMENKIRKLNHHIAIEEYDEKKEKDEQ